jgi:hypothetical protein
LDRAPRSRVQGVRGVKEVFFEFVVTDVDFDGFSVCQGGSQGVQELVKFFSVEVKDRSFLEEFNFFGFLDSDALASFATMGVLVRGDVLGGFA